MRDAISNSIAFTNESSTNVLTAKKIVFKKCTENHNKNLKAQTPKNSAKLPPKRKLMRWEEV